MSQSVEPLVTFSQELNITYLLGTIEPMVTLDSKQAFSDRFNLALDKAGIPPKGKNRQGIVGKMFGVSQKGARKWLEGEAIPTTSRLPVMAKRLRVKGEWLLTGQGAMDAIQMQATLGHGVTSSTDAGRANVEPVDIGPKIPLISWVQAGGWEEAIDAFAPSDADEWMYCPTTHSKHAFALTVRGDSMTNPYPGGVSFPEGMVVYVDPDIAVTTGAYVIAKVPMDNEATFKVYAEDAGRRFLKPLNPQYPTIECGEGCEVIGVVIGYYGKI